MNRMPTAAAAGKIGVGGDLTVNRLGFGAMRITGPGIWGDPPDRDRAIQAYCYLASQRADRLVRGREGGHRIGPDGAIHVGPDGLRCLAGIAGPAALSWRAAPELAAVRMGNYPDLPARGGDGRLGQGVHLLQPPPV
jgi:hypothetical protein